MNVRDLDGKLVKWNPQGAASSDTRAKSSLHERARELLKSKYPTMQFIEEVKIPVRWGTTLYLDFYCPLKKVAYEVHGEQHYKMIPHFHSNVQGFIKQKKRDGEKERWCELNDITLVKLAFNELDGWEEQI